MVLRSHEFVKKFFSFYGHCMPSFGKCVLPQKLKVVILYHFSSTIAMATFNFIEILRVSTTKQACD